MNTTPLIPYMRKSSGEDETLSRERQTRAIRAWAEAHGVELAPEVFEPRVSGSKDWRKRALGQVIDAVGRGEAAGVIVEEQSRLTRGNGLQRAEIWEALKQANARLVIVADGTDTLNGDYELLYDLQGALSREQWRQYKRRSDAVKSSRIDAGIFIGPAPTGYQKGPNRSLEPDELAPLVLELFELRAGGASWGDLLKHADARGHRFTQPGVAGIIRNRVYLGHLVYGDLVKENAHQPIVDAALWTAAQRRGKPAARSGRKTDKWLLSGFVVCGSCDHAMIVWRGAAQRNGRPQIPQRRYRCTNRACTARMSVDAPKIEAWALESLWALLGARVATERDVPDLEPLERAVVEAERQLEHALTPDVQAAAGDRWAAMIADRRRSHEEALMALGDARAALGEPGLDVTNLRERWDDMAPAERREALSQYALAAVLVHGLKPDSWELVLR